MTDPATSDPLIQPAMLDAIGDALSIAFIVYDKNDQITYASRNISSYFMVAPHCLTPGTRLRDFLGSLYDEQKVGSHLPPGSRTPGAREKWIAERISDHWRERSDVVERDASHRLLKFAKRRLSSGYGICVVSDVTEQKKREEQWRSDMERVQLTEEILDNLSTPVFVSDANLSLVAVNKVFCGEVHAGPEDLLDRSLDSVFPGEFGQQLSASARHVLETGDAGQTRFEAADGPRQTFRTQRVGKPGRYFLVTGIDACGEGSAGRYGIHDARPGMASAPVAPDEASPGRERTDAALRSPSALDGRKVLLITANLEFEAQGLAILSRLGVEACAIRSEEEEEVFLAVAAGVGVELDLIVVDIQMDVRCLEIAARHGVKSLTLDGFDISTELAYRVASTLGGVAEPTPDDWEITTRDTDTRKKTPGRLQVLVAEDNEVNQIVFSQILDGLGCSYKIVADGEEAVRQWHELRPLVILMDLTLPRLSGLDACRRIRQLEGENEEETPIIGVLTLAVDQDQLDCMAAGMNETILKPLSPDVVAEVLDRYRLQTAGYGF